jgi:hypothetical protein
MKWIMIILIPLTFFVNTYATGPITTLGTLKEGVRLELAVATSALLPDTVQTQIAQRSLLWVSTDCGGVEQTFLIKTVDGQAFYAIADTVVEILNGTMVIDNKTMSVKALLPQYFDDVFPDLDELESTNDEDNTPIAYQRWGDSIQLMPIPIRDDDSLYLKCFVEHRLITDDSMTIQITDPYTEAIILYASHLAYRRWQDYETSALYLAMYEKKRQELRAKYTPKLQILGTPNE